MCCLASETHCSGWSGLIGLVLASACFVQDRARLQRARPLSITSIGAQKCRRALPRRIDYAEWAFDVALDLLQDRGAVTEDRQLSEAGYQSLWHGLLAAWN